MAAVFQALGILARDLIRQAGEAGRPLDAGVLELPDRLEEASLTLAVLGQFKRGKSTLINALVQAPVLPASVLPLTSVVTRLRFGDRPALRLRFLDGREECVPVENLRDYVTEEANPRNTKGVTEAIVSWPSPFLDRPLTVVDTPGVGSVHGHNTEVSESFLNQFDAAVFVLGVDPVLTKTELTWLAKVRDQAERFFFVLNKTDQLSPEEVDQVIAFTRARLRDMWHLAVEVYPLSAKRGLADPGDLDLAVLRKDLEAFLDREGTQTLLRSARSKLDRAIRGLLASFAVERISAARPLQELAERLAAIREEDEKLARERTRAFWVLDDAQAGLLSGLRSVCDARWDGVREEVTSACERAWTRSSTVGAARRAALSELEERLGDLFGPLKDSAEALCREHFDRASAYLTREYKGIADRLVLTVGSWYGLALPSVMIEAPRGRGGRFYVWVPSQLAGLSVAGGSMLNLLPRALGARFAKRDFLKKVDRFYEMQRDRLLSDAAQRFQDCSGAVVARLTRTLEETTGSIRTAIERGLDLQHEGQKKREAALATLLGQEQRVRLLADRLDGLVPSDALGEAAEP